MQTEKQKNNNYKIDPREIDKLVADNIRKKRVILGLSQTEVAKAIGVSPQQVQKYERNIDRISSGRLYNLANFLKTPIAKLYH